MKFRRSAVVALAVLAFAAPAFAGKHVDTAPGAGDDPPSSGGVTSPALNVYVADVQTGQPIVGATGTLWSIPKQSWESPQVLGTATTGPLGIFYFYVPGYKGGDVFNLEVSATNYSPFTTLVWLSKGSTTLAAADLEQIAAGPKQGVPSSVKGTVSSTWGQIKSLY